jgi:dihydroxyacetone kinase-like protein
MDEAILKRLIETVARRVIDHADELTRLDQAIGDGDHGVNMKRGCEAVLADIGAISALPVPQALQKTGLALVMKVGGASGPLYGTLFMALGKELPDEPDRAAAVKALGSAIAAVKARGKSDAGQKTMLDVLVPVHAMLEAGSEMATLRDGARQAAVATVPMKATRGRASFLGERSIGHMDPGARSSALMVEAVLDVLEGRP